MYLLLALPGSSVPPSKELVGADHHVLGMTRSDTGGRRAAAGAQAHRGDLEDLEKLARRSSRDRCRHSPPSGMTGRGLESCELDQRAIETIGAGAPGLKPSVRHLAWRLGAAPLPRTIRRFLPHPFLVYRETTAVALMERGIHAIVMRLPQVHDPVKQGLIPPDCDCTRKGSLGIYRRRSKPLACRACSGCRPPVPACSGKGHSESPLPRRRRRGCGAQRHCHRDRRWPERARHFHFAGTGPGTFRLPGFFAGGRGPLTSSAQTRAKLGGIPTGPSLSH